MKTIKDMTQLEIGAFVQTHLRKNGIDAVLTGGSAISLYSRNRYISKDLDMVIMNILRSSLIRDCMAMIGFMESDRYYRHPGTRVIIEFPPGPLCAGQEPVREIIEKRLATGRLRVISPTDCVKDRLAAFYHWGDRQSLEQARMVCKSQKVDLQEVERWSKHEGKANEFRDIEVLLVKK